MDYNGVINGDSDILLKQMLDEGIKVIWYLLTHHII